MKFEVLRAVSGRAKGETFHADLTRELARQVKHRSLRVIVEGPVETNPAAPADKPLEALSASELKDLATAKGLDFLGNVSKAKLVEMLSAS